VNTKLNNRPLWFIFFEGFGVVYFVCIFILSISFFIKGSVDYTFFEVLISPIIAICLADILSGLIHYFADNIGDEETFILGPALIRPFREHHIVPTKMTKHDFIETNGSLYLICGAVLNISLYFNYLIPFTLILTGFIANTNQIHKLAHMKRVPGIVHLLRKLKLIISSEEHSKHHSGDLNSHYCITTGWFNRFFFLPK
jgi:ubiquitin-conjugating enzyme E2 variant